MSPKKRLPASRGDHPLFIACLHLLPLPGSPGWAGSMDAVIDRALEETSLFTEAGVDGLILENTHDLPYLKRPTETALPAAMTRVASEVRHRFPGPIGIQILAGANLAALDVALVCDLDFIRVEGFAFAHVADEGWIESDAGALMRRRAHLGADSVEVWADVKKKHSAHAVTADLTLREIAEGALFYGADGAVVTGGATGQSADVRELASIADLGLRKVVGSGITVENVGEFAEFSDALIVGSSIKRDGDWRGPVERDRVDALLKMLRG